MSGRLQNKVAIITGASSGIGKAFALKYAEEGAKLLITSSSGRGEAALKDLKDKGATVSLVKADISKEADCKGIADAVMKTYGRADILINNAAIWAGLNITPWDQWKPEDWDRIYDVNIKGNWMVCKEIAPIMIKQGKGKIINIASNVARTPANQFFLPYSCSKGAMYTLTHSLAWALGGQGINVNAIAPGYTASEASLAQQGSDQTFEVATGQQSIKRREEPTDLVGAAVFLGSEESDFINGQVLFIDGGSVML